MFGQVKRNPPESGPSNHHPHFIRQCALRVHNYVIGDHQSSAIRTCIYQFGPSGACLLVLAGGMDYFVFYSFDSYSFSCLSIMSLE
jgi:hypothetical protein